MNGERREVRLGLGKLVVEETHPSRSVQSLSKQIWLGVEVARDRLAEAEAKGEILRQ
jgi:hypothetical protein